MHTQHTHRHKETRDSRARRVASLFSRVHGRQVSMDGKKTRDRKRRRTDVSIFLRDRRNIDRTAGISAVARGGYARPRRRPVAAFDERTEVNKGMFHTHARAPCCDLADAHRPTITAAVRHDCAEVFFFLLIFHSKIVRLRV